MAHQGGSAKTCGVHSTQNSHCGPTPFKEHSAVLFLFGGNDRGRSFNDVWVYTPAPDGGGGGGGGDGGGGAWSS